MTFHYTLCVLAFLFPHQKIKSHKLENALGQVGGSTHRKGFFRCCCCGQKGWDLLFSYKQLYTPLIVAVENILGLVLYFIVPRESRASVTTR